MAEDHFSNGHRREGSAGSYGFALNNLAQGLDVAVENGWITIEEAKEEFRRNVDSIREKETRARHAAVLRAEADALEEENERK